MSCIIQSIIKLGFISPPLSSRLVNTTNFHPGVQCEWESVVTSECDEDNGPELTSGLRRVTGRQYSVPGHAEQTTPTSWVWAHWVSRLMDGRFLFWIPFFLFRFSRRLVKRRICPREDGWGGETVLQQWLSHHQPLLGSRGSFADSPP